MPRFHGRSQTACTQTINVTSPPAHPWGRHGDSAATPGTSTAREAGLPIFTKHQGIMLIASNYRHNYAIRKTLNAGILQ